LDDMLYPLVSTSRAPGVAASFLRHAKDGLSFNSRNEIGCSR